MDFITDLPLSRSFNDVFTIVDKLTKWVKLIPMVVGEGELSTLSIAYLFFDYIVCSFGVPQMVLHDWDPNLPRNFGLIFGSCWALRFLCPPPTTLSPTGKQKRCIRLWSRCWSVYYHSMSCQRISGPTYWCEASGSQYRSTGAHDLPCTCRHCRSHHIRIEVA